MFLKKAVLIGAAVTLVSMPLLAQAAELTTVNNTNEFSSVKVTSGSLHPCSGGAGQYTPPKSTLVTSWSLVSFLCMTSGNLCTADIYVTKDCSGAPIAAAQLDLANQNVAVTANYNQEYNVTASGTTVTLDYSKSHQF